MIVGPGAYTIELGSGSDTVTLAALAPGSDVFINDFADGPGGDVIDLSAVLASLPGYTPGTDPFVSGLLVYAPFGEFNVGTLYANVGGQEREIAELGTNDLSFSADNLSGFTVQSVSLTGRASFDGLRGFFGDDTLSGLGGPDLLQGGAGDDVLIGGAGADHLYGGVGSDTADYSTSPAGVLLNLSSLVHQGYEEPYLVVQGHGGDAEGDELWVADLFTRSTEDQIENLTGSAFADHLGGYADANVLKGGGGDDILVGAAGDDTLDGGSGADSMTGGAGNDTYYVDDLGDRIGEQASGGADTVVTSLSSYTLAANLEQLTYNGGGAFTGTGNAAANVLTGGGGADSLDAAGGGDTVYGGMGNDTITVDNGGDRVFGGGGTDTVIVLNSAFHLNAGSDVEILVAGGSNGVGLYGADGAQHLIGNAAANILDGGAGADSMEGGAGADTYHVDDVGDRVIEQVSGGADTVLTTLQVYTAPANVETVRYNGVGGDFNVTGGAGPHALFSVGASNATLHGGDAADGLTGGDGSDSLYGGAGNDVISGGGGDDYIRTLSTDGVDSIDGGAGTDLLTLERLNGTAALRIAVGVDTGDIGDGTRVSGIEQLRFAGGSGADSVVGGALDDVLKGSGGNDTLIGGGGSDVLEGGTGSNLLTGGTGVDIFRFDGAFAGSHDTVTDFASGVDQIALSKVGFGISSLSDFDIVAASSGPSEAKATLEVDAVSHTLSWDADGTGGGVAVLFAQGAFTTSAADYVLF